MADKKISQLSSASTPLAGTEVLPIVQSSTTVKVSTDDLTVKNVRSNATTGILQIAGPAAAATRVMTVPDANFTSARTDAAQTFTGDQTFSGELISSALRTLKGSANVASATPTTIFTSSIGLWVVYAAIIFSGGPNQYTAMAYVLCDGNGARIISDNGSNLTLTLSGLDVQITQTSGSAQTIYWSCTKFGL